MFAECLVIGVQWESWVVQGAYGGVSEIKDCSGCYEMCKVGQEGWWHGWSRVANED